MAIFDTEMCLSRYVVASLLRYLETLLIKYVIYKLTLILCGCFGEKKKERKKEMFLKVDRYVMP